MPLPGLSEFSDTRWEGRPRAEASQETCPNACSFIPSWLREKSIGAYRSGVKASGSCAAERKRLSFKPTSFSSEVIPSNRMKRMTYFLTRFSVALLLALGWQLTSHAQQSRIIIVNGGLYESSGPPYQDYVSVAYWDEVSHRQALVDTIQAQSVVDAVTYGDTLYVATDSVIRAYQLPYFQVIATSPVHAGMRKIAKMGSRIFATRGFNTPAGGSFMLSFDAATLANGPAITGVAKECEHLIVSDGTLYAAMPGPFGDVDGMAIRINTNTNQVAHTYDFSSSGNGISKLLAHNGAVIAACTGGFGSTQSFLISITDSINSLVYPSAQVFGYSLSGYDSTFFGQIGSYGLAAVNLGGNLVSGPRFSGGTAGFAHNPIDDGYIATSAGYVSAAKAYRFNQAGVITDSIVVGLAPEALVVWQQAATTVKTSAQINMVPCPNPASTSLNVFALQKEGYNIFMVVDDKSQKSTVLATNGVISLESLSPGLYMLQASGIKGMATYRFVKQ